MDVQFLCPYSFAKEKLVNHLTIKQAVKFIEQFIILLHIINKANEVNSYYTKI